MGHSTHPLSTFLGLLAAQGVTRLADVRRFPSSRRHPHFDRAALAPALHEEGIAYEHFPELGGRRRPVSESPNRGWTVEGFRGYADHMASEAFRAALSRLERAAGVSTAVMCAEGPWWRCHRRLVADALLARGWRVRHILPDGRTSGHELTRFAVLQGDRLVYPAPQ